MENYKLWNHRYNKYLTKFKIIKPEIKSVCLTDEKYIKVILNLMRYTPPPLNFAGYPFTMVKFPDVKIKNVEEGYYPVYLQAFDLYTALRLKLSKLNIDIEDEINNIRSQIENDVNWEIVINKFEKLLIVKKEKLNSTGNSTPSGSKRKSHNTSWKKTLTAISFLSMVGKSMVDMSTTTKLPSAGDGDLTLIKDFDTDNHRMCFNTRNECYETKIGLPSKPYEDFCLEREGTACGINKGIPRHFMPQIEITKIGELVESVNNLGQNSEEEKVTKTKKYVPLSKLRGIQGEAWIAKIKDKNPTNRSPHSGVAYTLIEKMTNEGEDAMMTFLNNLKPIIVIESTSEFLVLDGHHRFYSFLEYNYQTKENNYKSIHKIECIVITIPNNISWLDVLRTAHDLNYPNAYLTGESGKGVQYVKQ